MSTRPASLPQGPATADGIPDYLARHYWWAYLWRFSRPFFDHPAIISSILFGHYRELRDATLSQLDAWSDDTPLLQLTCVYGDLSNRLMDAVAPAPLHLTDVAALQLDLVQGKAPPDRLRLTRMNVEQLAYRDSTFGTALVFFLLHELPSPARRRVLAETLRVLRPGGHLVITEYAERPRDHVLYRNRWLRAAMCRAEPFLDSFWHGNLAGTLTELAASQNRRITCCVETRHFRDFYRVLVYRFD